MPSPFPGMDPYLESPDIWPDVHHELISDIRNALNKRIRPDYVARVEIRVYVDLENNASPRMIVPDVRIDKIKGQRRKPGKASNGAALAIAEPIIAPLIVPSEEIEEARVEIRHVKSNALVTVIELLSPSNKERNSDGRASFIQKRKEILNSTVNWVEIDLLRDGQVSLQPPANAVHDYRVAVSKPEEPRKIRFWLFGVRDPLPVVGIPLRDPDPDVPLDLGAALRSAYERAAYEASVDYGLPPVPRLSKEDARWADKLLRSKKLR